MKRLAVALLVASGCQSTLDLDDGGRAYECRRDAGTNDCRFGWACGSDNRCFDTTVGLTRPCLVAQTDCGGGWRCGLDLQCFDPSSATPRTCADPALHCPTGWRCGVDRICFDPASSNDADGGSRRCTDAVTHCATGQRCGLDGLCFVPSRSVDAGAGPECRSDDQCPVSWRCGAEEASGRRRCQPVGIGGPWVCQGDSDCEGWRCNPVDRVCVDVREPLPAPSFSNVTATFLSGADGGGTPDEITASLAGRESLPGVGETGVTTIASLTGNTITVGAWSDDEARLPDGGVFYAANSTFQIDRSRYREMAAMPPGVLVLLDGGTLLALQHGHSTPATVMTNVIAVRQSLNTPEVAALHPWDAGLMLERLSANASRSMVQVVTPIEPCGQNNGEIVDVAYAVEIEAGNEVVRSVWLTDRTLCFWSFRAGVEISSGAYALPAPSPRRLRLNAHVGDGAFTLGGTGPRSAINNLAIEFVGDAGQQLFAGARMSDWGPSGVAGLNLQTGSILPACPVCPDGVAATEVLTLQGPLNRNDQTVLVRCPASASSPLNDGGPLPEATYEVRGGVRDCSNWRRTRVLDSNEEAPRRWRVTSSTMPANRRVIAGPDGRAWLGSGDGGTDLKPLVLDRQPDFAVRVYLEPSNPRLFLTSKTRQFSSVPGFGVLSQRDFPDSLYPVGSVVGQATWALTNGLVMDAARFPPNSEVPFIVANAPSGVSWTTPTKGVARDGYLFVSAEDTISVGRVAQQISSIFAAPAVMTRSIVPHPGLPVRALAAKSVVDGGVPEVWSVTPTGVHRSTSPEGLNWTTTKIPLGSNDILALLPWANGAAVRLLLSTGDVLSLPTAVPLATPPARAARVISAERFCGATWAVIEDGAGDAQLYVLGATPSDGGLAGWTRLPKPATEGSLSTARLQVTALDLLLLTEWGDVVSLSANAPVACSAD